MKTYHPEVWRENRAKYRVKKKLGRLCACGLLKHFESVSVFNLVYFNNVILFSCKITQPSNSLVGKNFNVAYLGGSSSPSSSKMLVGSAAESRNLKVLRAEDTSVSVTLMI